MMPIASKEYSETEADASKRLTVALGFDVTRDAVREWRVKKYPLDDIPKLRLALLSQPRPPEGLIEQEVGPEINRATWLQRKLIAQTLKIEAEASLKALDLEAAQKGWFRTELAEQAGREIGAVFRSELLQIPNLWAPVLEGLPPAKMRDRMRAEVGRILESCDRLLREKGAEPGKGEP